MVPKLTGSGYVAPSCGGPDQPEWGGAATDTFAGGTSGDPDSMKTLQGYWNLIGVVQGSPPFAVNGAEPSSWDALSNVAFGTSTSTEVKSTNDQENSFLQSASAKLEIGLRRKDPEKEGSFLEPQLSQSYGHGWLSSKGKTTKSTVGIELEFGTDPAPSDPSALGTSGWAIFTAPTLIAQDFRLYAYDFSISSGSGTSLGQDAHTVSVYETPNLSHGSYVLGAPGGSGDSYPGLLAGVVGHAPSTDLETWGLPDPTDKGYTIVMGDGLHGDTQVPSLSYSSSGGTKVVISSENATLTGSGHTNDVGIEAGLGIKAATRINGLDGSAEGELTAGYEGNFAQTKETTTTTGTDVSVSVSLPPCPATSTDCLSAITVQPFWLQASDDTAPWVPTGRGDLPWFLTWTVTYWRNVNGSTGGHSWPSEERGPGRCPFRSR